MIIMMINDSPFLLQGLNLIFNDTLLLILKAVVFVLYVFFCIVL